MEMVGANLGKGARWFGRKVQREVEHRGFERLRLNLNQIADEDDQEEE
jgi:hypothetical protein